MSAAAFVFSMSPVFGILTFAGVHIVISRTTALFRPFALLAAMAAGLGVMAAVTATFLAGSAAPAAASDRIGIAAAWGLTYFSLAYFYVFGFYNLGESARRIRLLIELHNAGPRGMTRDELLGAYNARMIVEARLERLLAGGQIIMRGDSYVLAHAHVLYGAKALVRLKRLYLGAPSEFGYRSEGYVR